MPMLSGMAGLFGSNLLLSAVLIVRDEALDIADCLASLRDVVDEVVVYDTGSTDQTRELARTAGALVVEGFWDDDFGRARTDAAAAASGKWLLVVDADERLVANAAAIRAFLGEERAADCLSVRIDNAGAADGSPGYAHWGSRLVRRGAVRWVGAVHERPLTLQGAEPVADTMPGHLLSLDHLGYADPDRVRRKADRNALLAQAELDAMTSGARPNPRAVAGALLNLGRSLIGAGRAQDAVDTFETVREIAVPGTQAWNEATDHLARVLLGAGHDDVVVQLSEQLSEAGADPRYCDWLRAQALAQLGQPEEALRLVRGVDELIDPAGRRYDLGQVLEVRSLLAALLGLKDEALATLTLAVARHGRIRGRGPMLLELWGSAPASGLASIVRQSGSPTHLSEVAQEFRSSGGAGPEVAAALSV
jgi:tetratricopeptide (TPR) repeat protein